MRRLEQRSTDSILPPVDPDQRRSFIHSFIHSVSQSVSQSVTDPAAFTSEQES